MAIQYAPVEVDELATINSNTSAENPHKAHKWKQNIKLGCWTALGVFILNLCLLIWTEARHQNKNGQGITILYSGDCTGARNIALWSHLAINVASSLLLAAGNVCMQCLAAPTREEIDKAHSQHRWLDIGVNTIRNITTVAVPRRVLWALLGLSTVPLHLLYNSVIFEATVANDFMVATVSEAFADGIWTANRAKCLVLHDYRGAAKTLEYLQENIETFTRLDNAACISAYGKQFITEWGNVLLITSQDAPYSNESLLNVGYVYGESDVGQWICDGIRGGASQCETPGQKIADASQWSVPVVLVPDIAEPGFCELETDGMFGVSHCLAQSTKEACEVGVSSNILIVVLICNLIKILCMVWTFWKLDFEPLVTIGDAITCFLQETDHSTQGCGPMDAGLESWVKDGGKSPGTTWKGSVKSGLGATSRRRWFVCNILFVISWAAALVLLITTLERLDANGISRSLAGIASQGVGKFNTKLMVGWRSTTFSGNVLVANTLQFLVSLLYLLHNDLFTRVYIAAQWDSYSRDRKMLRVLNMHRNEPNASGFKQRKDYVLSLPLRISIPLLVAMMILHWLISQSLFLAVIGINNYATSDATPVAKGYPIMGLGFSSFAIVLALILGGLMVVGLWMNALTTRIGRTMPVVGTCSAAISAACHPPSGELDVGERPLSYGVVERSQGSQAGVDIPDHVCFTSGPIHPLVKGELYM